MKSVKIVSRLPLNPAEDIIYYSRNTREILFKQNGKVNRHQALYIPPGVDSFSVNKHYPLYSSEALALKYSPVGSVVAYGETELGPAPDGVNYPVYMPAGLSIKFLGDYIDPIGDDDGDGTLNFRDPNIVGDIALRDVNYLGQDPFITENNVSVNIKDYLDNPGEGLYNDSDSNIILAVEFSGIIVSPTGEISYFIGPGALVLEPGHTFFKDTQLADSLPLPDPNPPYTSDPFTTSEGINVNINDYISDPNSGSHNNTSSDIETYSTKPGILIGPQGEIIYFQPGKVVIPPGYVMFAGGSGSGFPLPSSGYENEDPFVTSDGASVNIKDFFDNPDNGFVNNTGSSIEVSLSDKSILLMPDGTVSEIGPGVVTIPSGGTVFSPLSELVEKAVEQGAIPPPIPNVSSASSIQWFEEGPDGDLILRFSSFNSQSPAIELWEAVNDTDYAPREVGFTTTETEVQYFEEVNGDIAPKEL